MKNELCLKVLESHFNELMRFKEIGIYSYLSGFLSALCLTDTINKNERDLYIKMADQIMGFDFNLED